MDFLCTFYIFLVCRTHLTLFHSNCVISLADEGVFMMGKKALLTKVNVLGTTENQLLIF